MDELMTTVVVTRNRVDQLARSLPRHHGPVIVVDNASTDGTREWVRRHHPRIELIGLATNEGAVARNVGVSAARTPYVAFADDDSWWAPGALDLAATCFESHPRLGLIAATVRVGPDGCLDPVSALMATSPLGKEPDLPGRSVLGFLACGAVVRRSAFLQAGGFDPVVHFGGEEERLALDLAAAGWGLAYVPGIVAHHHPADVGRPSQARARSRLSRNALLTAVMRRPWSVVASDAGQLLTQDLTGVRGIVSAIPRLPRAWARRRPVPERVEAQRRLLDR